jgi:hypothetical protein
VLGGAVIGSPIGPPSRALAAPTLTAAAASSATTAASMVDFVMWVAQSDPRSYVRSIAWSAVLGTPQDECVARFVSSDYAYAKQLAAEVAARNSDFVEHVLATHVPAYAPEVHAAARAAARGTVREREVFVASGYVAARERDRRAREASGALQRAIVQADRDFITRLRDHDPGPQVRAAAGRAVRPGGTADDLVEFFTHGWTFAAGLDLHAYRTELVDREAEWRHRLGRLVTEAEQAEHAAREMAGEAGQQAREAAARAWQTVGAQSGPARHAWDDAERHAAAQAAAWRGVADAAADASGPTWDAVGAVAGGHHADWAAERAFAATQAAHWQQLLDRALAAEQGLATPAG